MGSVGCVSVKDREGDCVLEKSEERYVACVSRVLGCSATATLSENLSSCAYDLQACEKKRSHGLATYQTFMNWRSLAWVERTHVNKNKIRGKFPKRGFGAV